MVPLAVPAAALERPPLLCSVSAAFQTRFSLRHGALARNGGRWQEEGECGRGCASAERPLGHSDCGRHFAALQSVGGRGLALGLGQGCG